MASSDKLCPLPASSAIFHVVSQSQALLSFSSSPRAHTGGFYCKQTINTHNTVKNHSCNDLCFLKQLAATIIYSNLILVVMPHLIGLTNLFIMCNIQLACNVTMTHVQNIIILLTFHLNFVQINVIF